MLHADNMSRIKHPWIEAKHKRDSERSYTALSMKPQKIPAFGKNKLVGGFNPSKKYQSNWTISPSRGENK